MLGEVSGQDESGDACASCKLSKRPWAVADIRNACRVRVRVGVRVRGRGSENEKVRELEG